ncbi:MAG: hypothetical protein ACI9MC_000540 [Kiritimatiellia bacterium]|jgi:hypothetical protein
MRAWWSVVVASVVVGCPPAEVLPTDDEPDPVGAIMDIDPVVVDFAEQSVGVTATPIEVEIYNRGDAPLDVYSIQIVEPGDGFSLGTVGQSQRIPVDSRGTFVVRFRPSRPEAYGTRISIDSNDTAASDPLIPLRGVGVSPALDVQPAELSVDVNAETVRTAVVLRNPGGVKLDIRDIEVVGHSGFSVDLDTARNGSLPFELEPLNPDSDKPTRTIFVVWTADGSESADAILRLHSNDFTSPVVSVPLSAERR